MERVRYVWRHPVGRLAVLMVLVVLVGVLGLTVHYWMPALLCGALRVRGSAGFRVRT